LVYNLIKEYLIEKEVQNDRDNDELFNDYYFIKAIYQKKDKTIFNKEFYSLLDKSIEYHDFMRASQLCDIGFVATGAQQIQNFQNIKNAVETLEKQQDILGQFYTLKNYVINNRITNMHAILSTKDREQLNLSPRSNIEYDIKKYQNDLISYYKIISASLIESDIPKKIALMESGYGYIEKVAKVNREYIREKDYCVINMASYSYINQDFDKAETLFKNYYNSNPTIHDYTLTSLINYGNCLLQLGKYSEILDIIVKYKQELDANQRLTTFVNALQCNVYVMTENTERLRKHIPISFQDLPDTFAFHFRFCLCILFYLEGDNESAIRESRNLSDTIAYKKIFEEHLFVAKLFHKFFDKYDKREAVDFKKYTQQILKELDEFEKTCTYNFKIFTPSKWLRKKIESI
jgi:hypothetical protein